MVFKIEHTVSPIFHHMMEKSTEKICNLIAKGKLTERRWSYRIEIAYIVFVSRCE